MHGPATHAALDALRVRIAAIETAGRAPHPVLPFGVEVIDAVLPEGGLRLGALHEVAAGGTGVASAAAAALFAAGIVARLPGLVLWCIRQPDLFAPALLQAGLDPDRVIYLEDPNAMTLLAGFEEGLRHGGLAGVVAEVGRLSLTASRRLQLAAETSGTIGLAVRRLLRPADGTELGQPTAAVTRWRVTAMPSQALPVPGIERARWRVELLRSRGGETAEFMVEACDEEGRLTFPAELADRPVAAPAGSVRAVA